MRTHVPEVHYGPRLKSSAFLPLAKRDAFSCKRQVCCQQYLYFLSVSLPSVANFHIPKKGAIFEDVIYTEIYGVAADKIVRQYREDALGFPSYHMSKRGRYDRGPLRGCSGRYGSGPPRRGGGGDGGYPPYPPYR